MIAYSPAVNRAAIPTEIRFSAENTSAAFLPGAGPRYCARGSGRIGSRDSGNFCGQMMRTVLPGVF